MKKALYIIVFFVLVAAAGGGYWYAVGLNQGADDSQWLLFTKDEVLSVHVRQADETYKIQNHRGGVAWTIHVSGTSWNVSVKGGRGRTDHFITSLSELVPRFSMGGLDQDGLADYGMNDPDVNIIVQFRDGSTPPLTLRFNKDDSGRVYGWNSHRPGVVYAFEESAYDQLARPAAYFFDMRLFHFDEQAVNIVQLVQPFGAGWLIEQRASGPVFQLPGYLKGKAAAKADVNLYLHTLAMLRANRLVVETVLPEKETPILTLKVWTGGGEPEQVEFFSLEEDPKTYLGRSSWQPVPFVLDAESVGQLMRSAFDMQLRTVDPPDIGLVESIIIEHGKQRYVLDQGETGWHLRGKEKNIPGIDMALWRFKELKFEALPLNNLSSSAVKVMQCQFLDQDGKLLKSVLLYVDPQLPQGQCWMKNEDGMFYPVSSRLLRDLQGLFPSGSSLEE